MNVTPQWLWAQDAIRRGWYIFPVEPGTKLPAVNGAHRIQWYEAATNRLDLAATWWEYQPEYNIGISCKKSRLLVVDCDTPKNGHPDHGIDQFERLIKQSEADYDDATNTYQVWTPSGGLHLYYNWTVGARASQRSLGSVLDVRTNGGEKGGYVVGAGSILQGGGTYHAPDGIPTPVQDVPRWLVERVRVRVKQNLGAPSSLEKSSLDFFFDEYGGLARSVREAAEGNRNEALNWAAHQMAKDGCTELAIVAKLLPSALSAGLDETESRRTIHSAWRASAP